ncbi:MAG TPA: twin-arginine translocase TatA/TatE family subunit [Blastocatellia bacterium]|nr:twin-arginine translocase TatA/TatE family subunit [Blastocatellia bacterium]
MGDVGLPEFLMIIAVILLLFGGSRIPEVGRSLGEAIRGFKSGLNGNETQGPVEKKTEQRE